MGFSVTVKNQTKHIDTKGGLQEAVAMAAATWVKKLEFGCYIDQNGERRKINGDLNKLLFA